MAVAASSVADGVLAAGLGAAVFGLGRTLGGDPWAGGALFVAGIYLAMAGHRSHLYESNTKLAAYLLEQLRRP